MSGIGSVAARGLLALVLAACAAGCGHAKGNVLVHGRVVSRGIGGAMNAALLRAQTEFPCPRMRLVVEDLGSGGFRVDGCGIRMTYTCVATAHGDLCVPGERASMMSGADPLTALADSSATWSDREIAQLRASIAPHVQACLPVDVTHIRVQVTVAADGSVRRVGAAHYGSEVAACIEAILARGRMGRTVTRPRTSVMSFARVQSLGAVTAPAVEMPSRVTPLTPPPPAPPGAEAAIRDALSARSAALMACVTQDVLALEVRWDASGPLTVSLRGGLAGSVEEGCVRALVTPIEVPPRTSGGTLLHVLTR